MVAVGVFSLHLIVYFWQLFVYFKTYKVKSWRRGPVDMSLDFKIERQYLTRVRLRGRVKVAKVMLSLAALQSFITTE